MARPPLDVDPQLPHWINGRRSVAVRATPGAARSRIRIEGERLVIAIHAPAVDGRANAAVLGLLAEALRISPSRLSIARGDKSRDKLVAIDWPEG